MKYIVLATVLALVFCTVAAYAGPLTGVPTIAYTDESGTQVDTDKDSGFGVGLGYSSFNYKLNIPASIVAGGASFDTKVSGPMLSVEYYKLMAESGGAFSVGGWWASVDSGNVDLGNVYGRYRFNRNWGVELGTMVADAKDLWGGMSYYVTYEPALDPKSNMGLQFGVGGMSETKDWMSITGVNVKTNYSAYGTATWALKNNWTANFGLWLLSQKYEAASIGKIADSTTFQWTIGAGYKF
jgi:hypothetical protein